MSDSNWVRVLFLRRLLPMPELSGRPIARSVPGVFSRGNAFQTIGMVATACRLPASFACVAGEPAEGACSVRGGECFGLRSRDARAIGLYLKVSEPRNAARMPGLVVIAHKDRTGGMQRCGVVERMEEVISQTLWSVPWPLRRVPERRRSVVRCAAGRPV